MSDASTLVGKLWSYCSVLRDDGLSYQDYLEQLTFLLFLKMADELTKAPFNRPSIVPAGLDWASLLSKQGAELETQYILILNELGREKGMLGVVFRKAQNRIQDPAKLERLIKDLIGGETWMTLDADVKGDAYEGLLEKNACRHQVWGWSILHSSGVDQGDGRRNAASARYEDLRPGVWDRRVLPSGLRVHRCQQSPSRPRSEEVPAVGRVHGLGDRRQHGTPMCDEPLAART